MNKEIKLQFLAEEEVNLKQGNDKAWILSAVR
jgi:hypothetical protein